MRTIVFALSLSALYLQAAELTPAKTIVDNERVTVWDVTWAKGAANPIQQHDRDVVVICLSGKIGAVTFEPKSSTGNEAGVCAGSPARSILIALKDHAVPPIPNKTGYPNAFPRPRVKKVFENDRVIAWDYTWLPGVPTPMHFHDKDVVVVYLEEGALKSTTPDGQTVINPNSFGSTKFNPGNRSHTEELARGKDRAIIVELK